MPQRRMALDSKGSNELKYKRRLSYAWKEAVFSCQQLPKQGFVIELLFQSRKSRATWSVPRPTLIVTVSNIVVSTIVHVAATTS